MKNAHLFVVAALGIFFIESAFASGKMIAKCSNGEEINLKIVQVSTDPILYRVDITTQSVGDSYPTFHFKNVEKLASSNHTTGTPIIFKNNDIEIKIQYDSPNASAILNVPSIGIDNDDSLTCR